MRIITYLEMQNVITHAVFSLFTRLKLTFSENCFPQNSREKSNKTIFSLLYNFKLVSSSFDNSTLKSIVTMMVKSKEISSEVTNVFIKQ